MVASRTPADGGLWMNLCSKPPKKYQSVRLGLSLDSSQARIKNHREWEGRLPCTCPLFLPVARGDGWWCGVVNRISVSAIARSSRDGRRAGLVEITKQHAARFVTVARRRRGGCPTIASTAGPNVYDHTFVTTVHICYKIVQDICGQCEFDARAVAALAAFFICAN